jgi:hypothetical protein
MQRAETFRFSTPNVASSKLSSSNRTKYLTYAFHLLKDIDNGEGGGYFLALHIGQFLGVTPIRRGLAPFQSDFKLPEYHEAHGLSKRFFQEPVDRALKWWDENKEATGTKN